MKWISGTFRFFVVTIGIIILTSLGIDATQYFEGSGSALSILTEEAIQDSCPVGTIELSPGGVGKFCIDEYEAGIGDDCSISDVGTVADSAVNVNDPACLPVSEYGLKPWTNVTYHQAAALCAKAGKRLANNSEWYAAALGTPDNIEYCNLDGIVRESSSESLCVSGLGVKDMIGNVWEFVDDKVSNGKFKDRDVPVTGYVLEVDGDGVALETGDDPRVEFNNDYFWSDNQGEKVMMRGGFYGSNLDAGVFAVHAGIDSSFSGEAIGFRCISEK